MIAELNGFDDPNLSEDVKRCKGIDLTFEDNPGGDFKVAAAKGVIIPKLLRNSTNFANGNYSESCEYQGFFYGGVEDWSAIDQMD